MSPPLTVGGSGLLCVVAKKCVVFSPLFLLFISKSVIERERDCVHSTSTSEHNSDTSSRHLLGLCGGRGGSVDWEDGSPLKQKAFLEEELIRTFGKCR